MAVVDKKKRAFVMGAGRPLRDDTWIEETVPTVDNLLKESHDEAKQAKYVEIGRRGNFACMDGGVSFGGGSRVRLRR